MLNGYAFKSQLLSRPSTLMGSFFNFICIKWTTRTVRWIKCIWTFYTLHTAKIIRCNERIALADLKPQGRRSVTCSFRYCTSFFAPAVYTYINACLELKRKSFRTLNTLLPQLNSISYCLAPT